MTKTGNRIFCKHCAVTIRSAGSFHKVVGVNPDILRPGIGIIGAGYAPGKIGNGLAPVVRGVENDCFGIILMCATLSGKIDALIRKTQLEDMTRAVIVNALASVAIEQLCDKAEVEIYENLDKCYKTWRYSPGYGDFPIELQKDILTVLDAPRKIGLCTGCSMTLTPIKSVTAVTGLSHKPVSPRKRGCLSCNLRNTCQYRKVGNHCVQ